MNRLYEIFKTPSGPSIGKALLNHAIFSPSQTGETVPLRRDDTTLGQKREGGRGDSWRESCKPMQRVVDTDNFVK